jgi:hypothetical protein
MSWRLTGRAAGGAITLDDQRDKQDLGDHSLHHFECGCDEFVREITFLLTRTNRLASAQLHIGLLRLNGLVCCPASVVASATKQSDLITDMAELTAVRELSASRFGPVRVVRTWCSERLTARFYTPGDRKETQGAFMERMQPFLMLGHPNVMRIRGLVCPTDSVGPIVLTEFSEIGSLEHVLYFVSGASPRSLWTAGTKMKSVMGRRP